MHILYDFLCTFFFNQQWMLGLFDSICISCKPIYIYKYRTNTNVHHKLPPGPSGLPILSHLHMLGNLPHRNLHKLAQKIGSIMYIRLGLVPTIVVSSSTSEAAELFLKTHDLVFASRPKIQASQHIFYGQRDIAFREYGPQWLNIRKVCMLELLSGSKSKIKSMKPMRKENVNCLVRWLKDAAEKHVVVDVSYRVGRLIEDMAFMMLIGRKEDGLDFKSTIQEMMNLLRAFNITDYIPFVGAFDIQVYF